jgi:hypothetical protein
MILPVDQDILASVFDAKLQIPFIIQNQGFYIEAAVVQALFDSIGMGANIAKVLHNILS